jgi:mannose-6-phosphate isomerase-like protein (cupin superfamily)
MNEKTPKTLKQSYADEGKWMKTRPGERCLIRESAEDTNGLYAVMEIVSSPGDGTPLHLHTKEDEHFFVIEGTARIAYGDKIFDLHTGEVASLRKGIPHAWGNRTNTDLRLVVLISPGGCEEALRMLGRDNNIDPRIFAERFHIMPVGPTPF